MSIDSEFSDEASQMMQTVCGESQMDGGDRLTEYDATEKLISLQSQLHLKRLTTSQPSSIGSSNHLSRRPGSLGIM
jgi:hypothetical protein